ncbi:hypothetical protein BJ875DRAFT_218933 [Amylocarpus encephaloides]|uniref:Uncharacterized protein n=1 Tax=Amylocarpus encephaloides TaxID=45428 RepID=A0A9P7Y867_9HELO|nr:hypothetical protein BJ875DRAFT_218933 [Amylocarpus encephaloides]
MITLKNRQFNLSNQLPFLSGSSKSGPTYLSKYSTRYDKHHAFRHVTDSPFIQSSMMHYHRSGKFAREFKKRNPMLLIDDYLCNHKSSGRGEFRFAAFTVFNLLRAGNNRPRLQKYELPKTADIKQWMKLCGDIILDG